MSHGWGYTKADGPHTWEKVAPIASGKRQSPIDIHPGEAVFDSTLAENPLKWKYVPENSSTLINSGHSVQVAIKSEGSLLTGGPIKTAKYQLEQFHFHWGQTSTTGSEHRIDGKMYAAELHFVHWNADLFSKFGDAVKSDNGLCVLGVFLQVGKENHALKKITDLYAKVKYAGDKLDLVGGFDPASLLPADTSRYWTYPGSLTTPPCFESVTWVVFQQPIEVSEDQMKQFRQLCSIHHGDAVPENELHGNIIENYRPPLAVYDRKVRASFQ